MEPVSSELWKGLKLVWEWGITSESPTQQLAGLHETFWLSILRKRPECARIKQEGDDVAA